jgi:hypothetical protein
VSRAQQQFTPLPVPPRVMQPDGVLQMLVDECCKTALRPQPFLARDAAICAVGVLAGRKYRTRTDLRTNVYVVTVAESGGGKDHSPEMIRRCFDLAKLCRYLGSENIASGRGMLSLIEEHPVRLFQIDEFGLFLATVSGSKAPTHKSEIWSELMKLYSRAKGIYRGTEYADKKGAPRIDIHQLCVCLLGMSTPSTFWKALEGGAMLARIIHQGVRSTRTAGVRAWDGDAVARDRRRLCRLPVGAYRGAGELRFRGSIGASAPLLSRRGAAGARARGAGWPCRDSRSADAA